MYMEVWLQESLDKEADEMFTNLEYTRRSLVYLKLLAKQYNLPFEETKSIVDRLFVNYLNLYEANPKEVSRILNGTNFQERSALHEMLYTFLENEDSNYLGRAPFVNGIKQENGVYNIETKFGTINLKKASDHFMMTPSRFIFKKTLTGMCFDRTTEFVTTNPEYEAIVSYLPNVFAGGYYHAYAKKDDIIVDPACNGIFFNGTGEIIEEGKIIYQTTAEELKNESDDYDYPKLLVAAIKNSRKK